MATKVEIDLLKAYCVGRGLNIGCGKRPITGAINVDVDPAALADVFGDAAQLPFYSERFDFVVSSHCLEHIREAPLIVLREWLRVLKVGGMLAFIVPDGNEGPVSLGSTPGEFIPHRHVHVFTEKTLRVLLVYAGADLLKIQVLRRRTEWNTNTILCVVKKIHKSTEELNPNGLRAKYSWIKQVVHTIKMGKLYSLSRKDT